MSLFDIFRDFSNTHEMQRLADVSGYLRIQSSLAEARHRQERVSATQRIEELEEEVARLTIVLEATIEKFYESGVLDGDGLAKRIAEIDLRDGVADGKITKSKPAAAAKKQVRKEVKLQTKKSERPPVKLVCPEPERNILVKDSPPTRKVFTKEVNPKRKF
ncbi:MAG: hypothetical protein V4727_03495 [Verrucomicrobiota bacterium]